MQLELIDGLFVLTTSQGLMLAKKEKEMPQNSDISSLEFSKARAFYCIQFWKSDKIYHPFEISSFVGKVI